MKLTNSFRGAMLLLSLISAVPLAACVTGLPTPAVCIKVKIDLSTAQSMLDNTNLAVATVQASLAAAEKAGADAATIQRIKTDLSVAQSALPIVQAALSVASDRVASECGAPPV